MRKSVTALCIILALAVAMPAFAAPKGRVKSKWWPGERPTPQAVGTLAGQITAITSTTITLKTDKGAPIFNIGPDTRVRGAKNTLSELSVGDRVMVNYVTLQDRNVWAKVINVP